VTLPVREKGDDIDISLMRTAALQRNTCQRWSGKARSPQVQELIRKWDPEGAASHKVKHC